MFKEQLKIFFFSHFLYIIKPDLGGERKFPRESEVSLKSEIPLTGMIAE